MSRSWRVFWQSPSSSLHPPENSPVISANNQHGGGLVGRFNRASALATLWFSPPACEAGTDGIEGGEFRRPIIKLTTRAVANNPIRIS